MRLHWLRPALADLDSIGDYLKRHDPSAAERIPARIINVAETLADQPRLGRTSRVAGTRELVVSGTPFILVYRLDDQTVELLGVIHSARRWPQRFD